jgi:hypothetical protein
VKKINWDIVNDVSVFLWVLMLMFVIVHKNMVMP